MRRGAGVAHFERGRNVHGVSKQKGVLLGKRRQTAEYRLRDEGRHLADVLKILRILYAMNNKVRALRQYCPGELAGPL